MVPSDMGYQTTEERMLRCIPIRNGQDIGPGTLYPKGYAIDEIVSLFYRGSYKLIADMDVDEGASSRSVSGFVNVAPWQSVYYEDLNGIQGEYYIPYASVEANREHGLYCASIPLAPSSRCRVEDRVYDTITRESIYTDIISNTETVARITATNTEEPSDQKETSGEIYCEYMAQLGSEGIIFNPSDGLYYPEFYAESECTTIELESFGAHTVQAPGEAVVGQINYLGEMLDLYGTTGYDITATMTFGRHKWWPYDPGDGGGPYYNINTGAKLR